MKTYRVTFTIEAPEECETLEDVLDWNDIDPENLKASIGSRNRNATIEIKEIEQ